MMSAEKSEKSARLRSTIDKMLQNDELISTRNIMKHLPNDFGYPNAITRPSEFKEIYEQGRLKQKGIRSAASLNQNSRGALTAKAEMQAQKIAELEAQIQVLVASHRAMYLAVGELGGAKAWLRFFAKHEAALSLLDSLHARPTTVSPLRPTKI